MRAQLTAITIFGAIFTPVVAGMVMVASILSNVMVHRPPRPPEGTRLPAPAALDPAKPNVVVILSNEGTELLDFLATYGLFATAEHWNVVTAAPERRPSPTTGAVGVLPDYSLAQAPEADVIVVPALMDPHNPVIADWIRTHAHRARKVVAPCEGSRLAARAGILGGRRATSHFLALDELKKQYPDIAFDPAARVASDGGVITSAGITGSIDAAITAIAEMEGDFLAQRVARASGLSMRRAEPRVSTVGNANFARLLLEAAYNWSRRDILVPLENGVDELGLAALLEVLPRTMSMRTFTVTQKRDWVRTRHGATLLATDDAASAPYPDYRLPPATAPESGQAIDRTLDLVAKERGADVARIVARLMEYPWTPGKDAQGARDGLPASIPLRIVLLMILGGVVAQWAGRSILKPR